MDCLLSSAAFWPISVTTRAETAGELLTHLDVAVLGHRLAMAWESVLTIQNSTPLMSLPTIRLTALEPPPPTPTTCYGSEKKRKRGVSRGGERGGRSERAARPRDVSRNPCR